MVGWEELLDADGYAGARDRGTLRIEGRDYVVKDGDVITISSSGSQTISSRFLVVEPMLADRERQVVNARRARWRRKSAPCGPPADGPRISTERAASR